MRRGGKVFRENPAIRLVERHCFTRLNGVGAPQQSAERFGNGREAHGVVSPSRKSPDLPPDFSTSRIPPISISRSTALAMS